MSEKVQLLLIQIVEGAVNIIIYLLALFLLLYSVYAMWDTYVIYESASYKVYKEYHPRDRESFEELVRINPEVIGWLTVDDTNIDYPVTQAENNSKYVNTDAKGNSALSGSLFLDCNNSRDFSDFNSVIYGHHMEKKKMFGEIEEFRNKDYFEKHVKGSLYNGERFYDLEFFAYIETDAYDDQIYQAAITEEGEKSRFLENLQAKAITKREIEVTQNDRIVILSTCANEETNGRQILVGKIKLVKM